MEGGEGGEELEAGGGRSGRKTFRSGEGPKVCIIVYFNRAFRIHQSL